MNVQELLAERRVTYDAISHRDTYDAQRLAQVLHVPGREVAKTVLLRADGGYIYLVCVLPATKTIDFSKLFNGFATSGDLIWEVVSTTSKIRSAEAIPR